MARHRVVFLQIAQDEESPRLSLPQAIGQALSPSISADYYRRIWRISRPSLLNDANVIYGRIGFERETNANRFDEDVEDFVEIPDTEGNAEFTQYVIDLEKGIIAAEEALPDIDATSLRVAFRGILKETYADLGLSVDFVQDEREFGEWLNDADSISRITISFHTPNPHFPQGADTAQAFIEHWNAKSVQVTAHAPANESLTVEDTELEDLSEYAHRYGRVTARGISDGQPVEYRSEATRLVTAIERPDDDTQEQLSRRLLGLLRSIVG